MYKNRSFEHVEERHHLQEKRKGYEGAGGKTHDDQTDRKGLNQEKDRGITI